MRTTPALFVALALAASVGLAGCGKNPTAAGPTEGKINAKAYARTTGSGPVAKVPSSATTAKAVTPAKAATTAAKATTTAKATEPAKAMPKAEATKPAVAAGEPTKVDFNKVTPVPEAAKPAADEGSMKLGISLTGNAPVTALGLKVFDQVDPSKTFEGPLTLKDGKAVWEQKAMPPGQYTVQVKALGADGKLLGLGSTEAAIKGGQLSDVALDLRVNMAAATGDGKSEIKAEDPAPGSGGLLNANIEIL